MRRVAVALAVTALTGCPPPPTTSLRVAGAPNDASVTIDDQYIGAFSYVASHGVALPPGKHRVTVEKPGYFPWDKLVEGHGDLIRLEVALVKIPE